MLAVTMECCVKLVASEIPSTYGVEVGFVNHYTTEASGHTSRIRNEHYYYYLLLLLYKYTEQYNFLLYVYTIMPRNSCYESGSNESMIN